MLEGQNIVCFAKDWSEDPTSNNHVMRLLSRHNKVLWVNSLAMRTPNLASSSDLKKMGKKAIDFAQNAVRGAEQVDDNMWVFTPVVLPLPHSPLAQSANKQILSQTLKHVRRRLGMDEFQLWTFLPTSVAYVGSLGESLVVYYVTDEFSQFSYLDTEKIMAMEKSLCSQADIVFCTAHSLVEAKKAYNPETFLASHGVDYDHFAQALQGDVLPADIKDLPRPIVGFFGLIHDWIDLDLIEASAKARPDWSFVMIGSSKVDVSRFDAMANVHMLGRKQYSELPAYCRGFDAALIPFAVNELTHHVNPIKLREYLSAGVPVVSTPLPEVVFYKDLCEIASTPPEFLAALDRAVQTASPEERRKRSDAMKKETWEAKVLALGDQVRIAQERKGWQPR